VIYKTKEEADVALLQFELEKAAFHKRMKEIVAEGRPLLMRYRALRDEQLALATEFEAKHGHVYLEADEVL
jgi:hypothetical protein